MGYLKETIIGDECMSKDLDRYSRLLGIGGLIDEELDWLACSGDADVSPQTIKRHERKLEKLIEQLNKEMSA